MKEQPFLQIEEVPTADLVPYANNAKIHDYEQIEQIEASIKEFGFNDPVAVWDNPAGDMEIVEGHGRVLAAKNLGIETLPIIRLDHLTDDQRRAYTHVHNQLTLNTGWNWETLEAEIAELDFEFEQFGFSTDNMDLSNLFEEDFDNTKKEPKQTTCPNCGYVFGG